MSDGLTTAAGMVIDAQGNVTYDFQGHVHAEGVDLDAVLAPAAPTAIHNVEWLDSSGHAVTAMTGLIDSGVTALLALVGVGAGFTRQALVLASDGSSDFVQAAGQGLTVSWDGVNLKFFINGVLKKTL